MRDESIGFRNIVSFGDAARAPLRFPDARAIEAYWDRLRGGRMVPCRGEVDPRDIGRQLDRAFILERLAPGVARFRLAGSHLTALMGMEVRGMPLTTFFAPDGRRRIAGALERVFDTPAKAWITLSGERGLGRPPLDACLMLLPLESENGEISRALGCLASLGPVGRTPRRFAVRDVQITPLHEGFGRERPLEDLGLTAEALPLAGEQPATPVAPRPARVEPGQRPHLYLVRTE